MTYAIRNRIVAPMIAIAALALPATSAFAQQAEATPPAAPGWEQKPAIDAATVDNFAKASVEVREVLIKWAPQIEKAQSDDQVQQLRQQQQVELVAALDANDLDVGTYNAVIQAANSDPALAQEIQEKQMQLR
ncbi:DUF4168 domain-containing protein [Martelella endophytica]|nr:DUF4168 domain-containing protein [Martelella endophytica]